MNDLNSDKSLSVSEIKEYPLEIFTNGYKYDKIKKNKKYYWRKWGF